MGGTAEVLQEYLVKLGYQTDAVSFRKFEDQLGVTGKKVAGVGLAVAGAVIAVEAAAADFAYSMRKVYFQSELSNTSVKNLKAMEFAGKQVGISAEAMGATIKNVAASIRLNPGLTAWATAMGVKVDPNNIGKVALDLVEASKIMPENQGARILERFGMDNETYHQWRNHSVELRAEAEKMSKLYEKMGFDEKKAAESALAYTKSLDMLRERASVLSSVMLTTLLPAFQKSAQWADHLMEVWTLWGQGKSMPVEKGSPLDRLSRLFGGKGSDTPGNRMVSGRIENHGIVPFGISDEQKRLARQFRLEHSGQASGASPPTFGQLESQYNLPPGLLDTVWAKESGRGKNMLSPAGAKGQFGFMDATAKQYGITDPNDLGQSSQGAAKMYAYLLRKYKGNLGHALGAYNWGEGNMDSYLKTGKGLKGQNMPSETRDYIDSISAKLGGGAAGGVAVNTTNTFNISGSDAKSTAREVAGLQDRVNANTVRQLGGGAGPT